MFITVNYQWQTICYICRMNTKNLITSGAVAKILNVSTQRIYAMIKEGKISPIEIGGIKFFNKGDIEKIAK